MTMEETIRDHEGQPLAVILRASSQKDGIHFVSEPEYPLQLGVSCYRGGETVKPHIHLPREITLNQIQEVLHVDSGRVAIDLYDMSRRRTGSVVLATGDTILLVSGGHGLRFLEETRIVEVKQGPYAGREQDKREIP
ncbi:MAG: hypothetical protein LUO86_02710 [Methanomicrobiales archaeon]|nr:hypothetical protein [Methanomicrobiales archaeon]